MSCAASAASHEVEALAREEEGSKQQEERLCVREREDEGARRECHQDQAVTGKRRSVDARQAGKDCDRSNDEENVGEDRPHQLGGQASAQGDEGKECRPGREEREVVVDADGRGVVAVRGDPQVPLDIPDPERAANRAQAVRTDRIDASG